MRSRIQCFLTGHLNVKRDQKQCSCRWAGRYWYFLTIVCEWQDCRWGCVSAKLLWRRRSDGTLPRLDVLNVCVRKIKSNIKIENKENKKKMWKILKCEFSCLFKWSFYWVIVRQIRQVPTVDNASTVLESLKCGYYRLVESVCIMMPATFFRSMSYLGG